LFYYPLAGGAPGPGDGPHRWESDLFSGLDVDEPAIVDAGVR
jgi:N-acetyl-1-D-myo-inositol-2-amino-2-deoxy-alpha-D-glucopyranoside deacetylase